MLFADLSRDLWPCMNMMHLEPRSCIFQAPQCDIPGGVMKLQSRSLRNACSQQRFIDAHKSLCLTSIWVHDINCWIIVHVVIWCRLWWRSSPHYSICLTGLHSGSQTLSTQAAEQPCCISWVWRPYPKLFKPWISHHHSNLSTRSEMRVCFQSGKSILVVYLSRAAGIRLVRPIQGAKTMRQGL